MRVLNGGGGMGLRGLATKKRIGSCYIQSHLRVVRIR